MIKTIIVWHFVVFFLGFSQYLSQVGDIDAKSVAIFYFWNSDKHIGCLSYDAHMAIRKTKNPFGPPLKTDRVL